MKKDAYVDIRHLKRIAKDIDALSACVVREAIKEIEYKRSIIKKVKLVIN